NDEIHLHVPGTVWDELLRDLPASGERYRKIQVWNGGRYRKAKLRIRGNSGFHWLFDKRSLKVKTSKKHLLRGYRHINLSVKLPYVESLAHEVARQWGLLTPLSWPVRVFTDGQLYGTMRFVEDIDESFLRRHGRMPGDIFKGEGSPFTNEWHYGTPVNFLLRNPYVWPLLARDNSLPRSYRGELAAMARAVDLPGTEGIDRLRTLFDPKIVVRHIAFHLFLNELHAVDANNLKLYLDPLTGRLEPIVWDPYIGSNRRIFSGDPNPHYPVLNSVFYKLAADPRLMQRVFVFLDDRLRHPEGLVARIDRLHDDLRRHRQSFKIERSNPWFPITSWFFDANVGFLQENRSRILDWIGRTRLVAAVRGNAAVLGCRGVAGVRLLALELGAPAGKPPRIVEDRNRNLRADPGEPVLRGPFEAGSGARRWFVLDEPLLILPAYVGINRVATVPLAYPLLLPPGVTPANARAVNAVTGKPVSIDLVESWPAPPADVIHPWDEPTPPRPRVRTAPHPVFRVDGVLRIPANETLIIEPGTTVVLAPGATVQSFGKILARGTAAHPIVFRRADPARPWGCLALQGPGTAGSTFRHVTFRGGSQARFGALHYSGMVNVHRSEDVSFDRCELSGNVVGDDGLHVARSTVRIESCFFHDTNSDALDMDYSGGRVAGCRFERVGNDAIDLMTSSPV
ncbi:MAG TPA: hypothetical protein ENK19_04390, partial [Acidobacteria bacterium]|nr:hypothetical protein [Acidobacteriota bacterium]